jgi:hypothetical protein
MLSSRGQFNAPRLDINSGKKQWEWQSSMPRRWNINLMSMGTLLRLPRGCSERCELMKVEL